MISRTSSTLPPSTKSVFASKSNISYCEITMASPTSQAPLTPPTSSTPEHKISVAPKLRLCLKRKNNHYVPLVAVDELPSWIKLKGVPMNLCAQDVADLQITNCGDYPRTYDGYYQVELDGPPAELQPCNVLTGYEAGGSSISQNSSTTDGKVFMAPDKNGEEWKTSSGTMGKEKAHIKDVQVFPFSPGQCIILNWKQVKGAGFKMQTRVPTTKQGQHGTFGRNIFCSYYLRRGECDYEQTGCKFRHDLPEDPKLRRDIGFLRAPAWIREHPTESKPAEASQVNGVQQATWRRGMTQDVRRELPASQTHGQRRSLSNIAAPIPHSDLVQRSGIIQAPIMTPTNTNGQAVDARTHLHKLQAAQQAALFLPHQQYFPSSTASVTQDLRHMQLNTFDGANGNTSFQPMTPTHHRTGRSRPSTNELFSNAKVVGSIERRHEPATQPPISRPVVQDLETYLKGKETTNATVSTPSQGTAEAIPQASAPVDPNTTTSTHTMKVNRKAFSINGSVPSTSQAGAPGNSGPKKAASDTGAHETISSLVDGSIASPRVMHRRLFVPPGEPQYLPNPIAPGSSKPRQRSRSNRRAHGKARGCGTGKAGQSASAPKAQVQAAQEEELVLL